MQVITRSYGNKVGINYLIEDITQVTAEQVLRFWRLLTTGDAFHEAPHGVRKITRLEITKMTSLLEDSNIESEVEYCLSVLVSGQNYDDWKRIRVARNRLIFHLVCLTTGYTTRTVKEPQVVGVSCWDIYHFGSVKKAVQNELTGTSVVRYEHGYCGCDFVKYKMQLKVNTENNYEDTECVWYPSIHVAKRIEYAPNGHQKYILPLLSSALYVRGAL